MQKSGSIFLDLNAYLKFGFSINENNFERWRYNSILSVVPGVSSTSILITVPQY